MADNFGLKIGLEGEKEFKKALSEINQSFKVLGSEMKVVTSQFDKNDNSVQALTARNQVLNKEIEAQKQKIETLRAALANASESFGENDRRTQSWQIQLNNATAALNDMERELDRNNTALDEAEREMDDVADSANDMEEEIDDAGDAADKSSGKFEKFGSVLKGIGAAMALWLWRLVRRQCPSAKRSLPPMPTTNSWSAVSIPFLRNPLRNCRPTLPTHIKQLVCRQTTTWRRSLPSPHP